MADWRGALITPPAGYRIKVIIDRGATPQNLLTNTKKIINEKPCELFYILGGICSITEKADELITLPFETDEQIYQQTKDLLKAVITDLDKYDTTPVILCQIVGVELNMVNTPQTKQKKKRRKRHPRHPKQDIMDSSIIKINTYIILLNPERGNETPELASYIHKHHGAAGWKRMPTLGSETEFTPRQKLISTGPKGSKRILDYL